MNLRVATGILRFKGDWNGVYIRGDDAKQLAADIELAISPKMNLGIPSETRNRLAEVARTLRLCEEVVIEPPNQMPQVLNVTYAEATQKKPKSFWERLFGRDETRNNGSVPPPGFEVGLPIRVLGFGSDKGGRILSRSFDYSDNWAWKYAVSMNNYGNTIGHYHESALARL